MLFTLGGRMLSFNDIVRPPRLAWLRRSIFHAVPAMSTSFAELRREYARAQNQTKLR